jgi:hypothetical protein
VSDCQRADGRFSRAALRVHHTSGRGP